MKKNILILIIILGMSLNASSQNNLKHLGKISKKYSLVFQIDTFNWEEIQMVTLSVRIPIVSEDKLESLVKQEKIFVYSGYHDERCFCGTLKLGISRKVDFDIDKNGNLLCITPIRTKVRGYGSGHGERYFPDIIYYNSHNSPSPVEIQKVDEYLDQDFKQINKYLRKIKRKFS